MWRFIFAFPLFMHGLAHFSGFLASWTSIDAGFPNNPWIISGGVKLRSSLGRIFGLLWLIAMLGLVGSAFGLVFQQAWWPILAIVSSIISLFVIVPWWNSVPPGAKFGALFDLLVIIMLLSPFQQSLIELV